MLKELIKVANKLDMIGLTKEATALDDLIKKIAEEEQESSEKYPLEIFPEPSIKKEDVAAAFTRKVKRFFGEFMKDVKILDVKWSTKEETAPTYHVTWSGTYLNRDGVKTTVVNENDEFWEVEGPWQYVETLTDADGKEHYFYAEF